MIQSASPDDHENSNSRVPMSVVLINRSIFHSDIKINTQRHRLTQEAFQHEVLEVKSSS